MWFIIDDQMADDRRIRRLPLATVGLWVKLCVIHSKGVSMQSRDPNAYPGRFDKLAGAARSAPQGRKQGRTKQGRQPESQANVRQPASERPSERGARR